MGIKKNFFYRFFFRLLEFLDFFLLTLAGFFCIISKVTKFTTKITEVTSEEQTWPKISPFQAGMEKCGKSLEHPRLG